MKYFPLGDIDKQSDVMPILVAHVYDESIHFLGVSNDEGKIFSELAINDIAENLPYLGTLTTYIFFIDAYVADGERVFTFETSVQIDPEKMEVDVTDLGLSVFSQREDATFDSPLTWNPLLEEHCDSTLKAELVSIGELLVKLLEITLEKSETNNFLN